MSPIILTTPDELRTLIFDTVHAILCPDGSHTMVQMHRYSSTPEPVPLNVQDAAKYLGLAEQTLYGYTSKRTIPFLKRGKRIWFLKTELDSWLLGGHKSSLTQIRSEIASKS